VIHLKKPVTSTHGFEIGRSTKLIMSLVQEEEEAETMPVEGSGELSERIERHVAELAAKTATSRAATLRALSKDLAALYGYRTELTDLFLKLFAPQECVEFVNANEQPRPVVIRVNTLKVQPKALVKALTQRGARVEPLPGFTKHALRVVESTIPVGATPEYLGGHYMLQSASSLCPVLALAPRPGERVLDVAAAPGGKTSFISQLMGNVGVVVSNDVSKERHVATLANLHRLGVSNVLARTGDGRKFPEIMGSFDRVLLDAPCSGLGIVARDPNIKAKRSLADLQKLSQLQRQLLLSAIDSADAAKAGVVVYSTCSIAVEENEAVVQYALDHRPVRLLDVTPELDDKGRPGFKRYQHHHFHPSMAHTRRFFPHVHNMDGFFVAKFHKLRNSTAADGTSSLAASSSSPPPQKKKTTTTTTSTARKKKNKAPPTPPAAAGGKKKAKKARTSSSSS